MGGQIMKPRGGFFLKFAGQDFQRWQRNQFLDLWIGDRCSEIKRQIIQ